VCRPAGRRVDVDRVLRQGLDGHDHYGDCSRSPVNGLRPNGRSVAALGAWAQGFCGSSSNTRWQHSCPAASRCHRWSSPFIARSLRPRCLLRSRTGANEDAPGVQAVRPAVSGVGYTTVDGQSRISVRPASERGKRNGDNFRGPRGHGSRRTSLGPAHTPLDALSGRLDFETVITPHGRSRPLAPP
jgi:hypothetical protein